MNSSIRTETLYDGAVERIVLNSPKQNILNTDMVSAIRSHLLGLGNRPALRLVLFEGEGHHFSYGASVEEHLPGQVERMLPTFHGLFRTLEGLGIPTAALVRGQCLGGGLELAMWCGTVFAESGARMGVPEVKLAVFPPVAAMGLHWRVGGSRASRLICTGAVIDGATAYQWGLVDYVEADLERAWRAWFEESYAGLSAFALRAAWRASRRPLATWLYQELPALEASYLGELMSHVDPREGLSAFVERRSPTWVA